MQDRQEMNHNGFERFQTQDIYKQLLNKYIFLRQQREVTLVSLMLVQLSDGSLGLGYAQVTYRGGCSQMVVVNFLYGLEVDHPLQLPLVTVCSREEESQKVHRN